MKQNTRTTDGKILGSDVYDLNSLYPPVTRNINKGDKQMRISNINEPAPKLRIGAISQYYIGRYGTHELVFTATIKYCDNKEAFIAKVLEFDKLGQFIYDILQTLRVPSLDKIVGASLAFTIDKSNMVHEIRPFASAKKVFDLDAYFNDTEEGSTISEKLKNRY